MSHLQNRGVYRRKSLMVWILLRIKCKKLASRHNYINLLSLQEVAADRVAQYQSLTNMELISLLLQQEMDMEKQQAASDQQGAQLQKVEAELKKVKAQVRDLEDYIDNLLLRIMEQTPTLLQVRSRHK